MTSREAAVQAARGFEAALRAKPRESQSRDGETQEFWLVGYDWFDDSEIAENLGARLDRRHQDLQQRVTMIEATPGVASDI